MLLLFKRVIYIQFKNGDERTSKLAETSVQLGLAMKKTYKCQVKRVIMYC